MNYLAFDLGASSGKLFLGGVDGGRLRLREVHRFENGPVALARHLYWDFFAIHRNLCEGIRIACAEAGGPIASLGIDSFSNDFCLIGRDGALLTPMRCYRDDRTARAREAIFQKCPPRRLYTLSGNQVALFNTAMQLAAMREENDRSLDSGATLLLLPDLLCALLTGDVSGEYTISSVTQLFDFAADTWHAELLKAFGIPAELLPPVCHPGSPRGVIRPETGLPAIPVVTVCEHDTASAFLAAPLTGDAAIISSGTWSLVGTETPAPVITEYGFAHNVANEGGLPGHHRLLRNVMGSWLLQELRAEYAGEGVTLSFGGLAELGAAEPPFSFLIDVDDECFFSPGDVRRKIRSRGRGAVPPERPGQFVRCICESLALKYRYSIEVLEELCGRPLREIHIVGGGSKDSFLCQLTADACGRSVHAGPADASAVGNLLVQLMAAGELESVEAGRALIRASFPIQTFAPRRGEWDAVYRCYCEHFHLK
ncbi:rhamnulokinase [Feifania hominis]|uniref:Rhamnulokinase n=1 Tax=Feifania hominis TaxID=2763660 RepID=A0A926DFI2_9FIRM|nr:rhamnulokinase family protein [Feifania hominis]MBC8536906.1 rhamnulokinase [Feifania hominis]